MHLFILTKKYKIANYCPRGFTPTSWSQVWCLHDSAPHHALCDGQSPWFSVAHVGGCQASGQCGTYLCDFLWYLWVDVQHVVSGVPTSMISLVYGWMSRAWSLWYLPPWFVFLACVNGSPVSGQCGTYLCDFLWHMWVVVQQAVSVITEHHQHVRGHFGHLLVHTLKQSPS